MDTPNLFLFGLLFTIVTATPYAAHAQEPKTALRTYRWGVEIDLVQPFIPTVHIIRPKVTRTLWRRSTNRRADLILGLYIRPHVAHDILETIDEYMGTVGYRQYLWQGFHLETMVNAGAAWGTNQLDGKKYTTASLFMDVNAGYRLGFFEPGGLIDEGDKTAGFYVAAQAGVIFSLGVADIGPRDGKPDWFPQGNLLVGTSF